MLKFEIDTGEFPKLVARLMDMRENMLREVHERYRRREHAESKRRGADWDCDKEGAVPLAYHNATMLALEEKIVKLREKAKRRVGRSCVECEAAISKLHEEVTAAETARNITLESWSRAIGKRSEAISKLEDSRDRFRRQTSDLEEAREVNRLLREKANSLDAAVEGQVATLTEAHAKLADINASLRFKLDALTVSQNTETEQQRDLLALCLSGIIGCHRTDVICRAPVPDAAGKAFELADKLYTAGQHKAPEQIETPPA